MLQYFRQAMSLLSRGERRRFFILLCLSALAAVIQTIAVLSIMPFILLLSDPEMLDSVPRLRQAFEMTGSTTYAEFVVGFGLFGVAVLATANLFVALEHGLVSRFLASLNYRMQVSVLGALLHRPYDFFLRSKSARLSDVVLTQVERVTEGVIGQFMIACGSGMLAVFVVLMLLIVSWKTTVIAFAVLFVLFLLVFLLLRRRLASHGARLTALSGDVFHAVGETFDGMREIKTRGAEDFFLRRFNEPTRQLADLSYKFGILSVIPNLMLETLIFAGLVGTALYFILAEGNSSLVLPLIALYGFATYRLVPSLKSFFEAFAEIQHNMDALDVVRTHSTTRESGRALGPVLTLSDKIRVDAVSYRFDEGSGLLLDSVDLTIPAGSSLCLFGPSGSGKTTLLNILAGLLYPSSGRLLSDGVDITEANVGLWRQMLGYCPQKVFLFNESIRSNIAFGSALDSIDEERVIEAAKTARLDDLVGRAARGGFDAPVSEQGKNLSGGQGQRIGIARTLYHDPSILILDESFNGLDADNRDAILDNLFALDGRTLVFASHDPAIARRCDVVAIMEGGKIVASGAGREIDLVNLVASRD